MLNYKSPSPTKRINVAAPSTDGFGEQQYRKRGGRAQGQMVSDTMIPYESYLEVPYQPQGANFGMLPGPASQWYPYMQPGGSTQWAQGWGYPSSQPTPRGVQYVLPGTDGNVHSNSQGYIGYPEMHSETDQQQPSGSAAVDISRNNGHMMPSDPLLYLQQQQQSQQQQSQQQQQQQQPQQIQLQQQATESSAVLSTLLKQQSGSSQQSAAGGQQATPTAQVTTESESSGGERLPTFNQAFSQTEIGRYSHEGFHNKQSDLPVVEGDLGLDLTFKMECQSRNGYAFSPTQPVCDLFYGMDTMIDNHQYNFTDYDRQYPQNRLKNDSDVLL